MAAGGFAIAEYQVPKAGLLERVPGGALPKDPGTHSSRLAQVVKAAAKTPGPGKYDRQGTLGKRMFMFSKTSKDKYNVAPASTPAPGKYNLVEMSKTKARVTGGQIPKGKGHRPIYATGEGPAPGKYDPKLLENHVMAPSMTKRVTETRKDPAMQKSASVPGPGRYSPSFDTLENREANYSVPRAAFDKTRFVDTIVRSHSYVPAPGKYDLIKLEKVSRGTKWCQINGLGRSPVNGIF